MLQRWLLHTPDTQACIKGFLTNTSSVDYPACKSSVDYSVDIPAFKSIVDYPAWIYSHSAHGVPNGRPLVSRIIRLEDANTMGSITSSSRLLRQLCDAREASSSDQCQAVWSHLGLHNTTKKVASKTTHVGASKHGPPLSYFSTQTCAQAARQFNSSFDAFGYDSAECSLAHREHALMRPGQTAALSRSH